MEKNILLGDKLKDHSEQGGNQSLTEEYFFPPGYGPSKHLPRISDLSRQEICVSFAFSFLDGMKINDKETTVHYSKILGFEFDAVIIWNFQGVSCG